MYDDLATLMRDATEELLPPPAAAGRALKAAAQSRRRTAILAGTGGVAAVGLVAVGVAHLPAGRGPRPASVAAEPSAPEAVTASPTTSPVDDASPAQLDDDISPAPESGDAAFDALTLPNTLPNFPVNLWQHPAADSFQSGNNNRVYTGPGNKTIEAPVRLFGWNHAPYAVTRQGNGVSVGTPVGPQLRLDIVDRPDVYVIGSDGKVTGTTVNGPLIVRGQPAIVSHDKDDLYVSLTYGRFSIQAMGGNGATVDDLVMTIDAIEGLNATDAPTTDAPTTVTAGTEAPATQTPTTVTAAPKAYPSLRAPLQPTASLTIVATPAASPTS